MDVYSKLVESLEKCDISCNNCAISSLEADDRESMSDCVKFSLDCADVCHLTLRLLARDSSHAVSAVKLCMTMCDECATECEQYEYDACQLSAEACRQTEKHCGIYLEQVAEMVSI